MERLVHLGARDAPRAEAHLVRHCLTVNLSEKGASARQTLPPVALTQVDVICSEGAARQGSSRTGLDHGVKGGHLGVIPVLPTPSPNGSAIPFLSKVTKTSHRNSWPRDPAPHSVGPTLAPSAHTLCILLLAGPGGRDRGARSGPGSQHPRLLMPLAPVALALCSTLFHSVPLSFLREGVRSYPQDARLGWGGSRPRCCP